MLHDQKVTKQLRERLQLPKYVQSKLVLKKWRQLAVKSERNTREVKIALVGKYVAFEDAYVSVVKGNTATVSSDATYMYVAYVTANNCMFSIKTLCPCRQS